MFTLITSLQQPMRYAGAAMLVKTVRGLPNRTEFLPVCLARPLPRRKCHTACTTLSTTSHRTKRFSVTTMANRTGPLITG